MLSSSSVDVSEQNGTQNDKLPKNTLRHGILTSRQIGQPTWQWPQNSLDEGFGFEVIARWADWPDVRSVCPKGILR